MDGPVLKKNLTAIMKARNSDGFSFRMAPMIDVIFLLLIFFFVSWQFVPVEDFLPLDVPKAIAHGDGVGIIEPFVIEVSSNLVGCQITFSGQGFFDVSSESAAGDLAKIIEPLRQVLSKQKRLLSDPVELVFGNDVEWDYTAKIYNLLYGLGFKDITFRLND